MAVVFVCVYFVLFLYFGYFGVSWYFGVIVILCCQYQCS